MMFSTITQSGNVIFILLLVLCVRLCYAVLHVLCCIVITCWERADLFALLCVMFTVFLSLPHVSWAMFRGSWPVFNPPVPWVMGWAVSYPPVP